MRMRHLNYVLNSVDLEKFAQIQQGQNSDYPDNEYPRNIILLEFWKRILKF